MSKHTLQELQQWQALPLNIKIRMTKDRIRQWIKEYGEDGVYVSFSGGKDSTVLLDLVRQDYPNVKAMFVDVPTQYPELKQFVQTFENVDIVKPKISFIEVVKKYGFPLISKEVAENVEGARRYLTKLIEEQNLLQTDRQRSECLNENTLNTSKKTPTIYTNTKLVTFLEHGNKEELAKILNSRMKTKSGGSNQRLAIMLGWLTKNKEIPIAVNIPESERSNFSMTRWKFMLEAPFEISNKCCNVMKKEPAHRYSRQTSRYPMTAQMASESRLRTQKWIQNGCNGFDLKEPISNPMAFWTEQDILLYIKQYLEIPLKNAWNNIGNPNRRERKKARKYLRRNNYRSTAICSVYGDIVEDRSGTDEVEGQMTISDIEGWENMEIFDMLKDFL